MRFGLLRDLLERSESSVGGCWDWYWLPMVRRSVMADDFVYAISSGGIRAARVDDLANPIATVAFDRPAP